MWSRVGVCAIVVQQKKRRPVQFELMDTARKTMLAWLERRGGTLNDFRLPSRNDYMAHMSTRQYARLLHEWVVGIGLPPQDYGTHSLRRTKASIIYKATGNLRAVQILLGHVKIDSTVRYLGVDVEDAWSWQNGPKSEQTQHRPIRADATLPRSRRLIIWPDFSLAAFG